MHKNFKSNEFHLLEFESLRNEIATSKRNMFQLTVGGAAIIPAAQSVATNYAIGALTLALPMILLVLVLLFISENHAMMRAGQYILENIEPKFSENKGWEYWLNSTVGDEKSRSVDKILNLAFSILSSFYFVVSVVLAWRYASIEFGTEGRYVVASFYVAVGLLLAFIFYSQARHDTKIVIKK